MMRTLRFAVAVLALAASALLLTTASGADPGSGVKTEKQAYLVPSAPGVEVDAILSTGDIVGGYQMSGIPDGLGAYSKGHGRSRGQGGSFTVVMNHELGSTFPGLPPGVDTRVSRLVIDRNSRSVTAAEYLFKGNEDFERFCSSTLRLVNGRPLYFTGEETDDSGHFGSSVVLDPETGEWRETPHFGHLQHENVVPLRLSKWVFLTSEDDFRPGNSYLYAYIAPSFQGAVSGSQGSLYVWTANDSAETGNATATKGESIRGHFVPIPQSENTSPASLKAASAARGAFAFDRLEDIAVRPDVRGRTYIADTGKSTRPKGRVYQFDVDAQHPTRATLKMILNGDAPDNDDVINPDNMDASGKVLVIQEDREAAFRGDPNRVLTYNFRTKAITSVAEVRTPDLTAPFTWESSGVIDARRFLGRNWWLLDVQAHSLREQQPGPTLEPNTAEGEDGQLLAIYIPNSVGSSNR